MARPLDWNRSACTAEGALTRDAGRFTYAWGRPESVMTSRLWTEPCSVASLKRPLAAFRLVIVSLRVGLGPQRMHGRGCSDSRRRKVHIRLGETGIRDDLPSVDRAVLRRLFETIVPWEWVSSPRTALSWPPGLEIPRSRPRVRNFAFVITTTPPIYFLLLYHNRISTSESRISEPPGMSLGEIEKGLRRNPFLSLPNPTVELFTPTQMFEELGQSKTGISISVYVG
ncbi:hypothetical protein R3P38DRAFT_2776081 [Favolaschia claudopus]|uniref:Uncharacterized protein n=1 Tax=Favolaschia claudopus TaxID=2862362 RepID=A0AAW0BQB5_9AGAR